MAEQTEKSDDFYSKVEKIMYDAIDSIGREGKTLFGNIKPSEMRESIKQRSPQILEATLEYNKKIQNYEQEIKEARQKFGELLEKAGKLESDVIKHKETIENLETRAREAEEAQATLKKGLLTHYTREELQKYLDESAEPEIVEEKTSETD